MILALTPLKLGFYSSRGVKMFSGDEGDKLATESSCNIM